MNKKPFFSIIVPAYNTAMYLHTLLDSLLLQDFRDFELLFMVEKSSDNSLEICRSAAENNTEIKVFELPLSNSVSASRNYGIDKAKGEYIIFVDGDDWLEKNALKRCYDILAENPVDVLAVSAQEHNEQPDGTLVFSRYIQNFDDSDAGKIFSGREFILRSKNAACFAVLNICRREFLLKHRLYQLPEVQQEDTDWTPRVWFYAEKITVLPHTFYHYRRRHGSLQSSSLEKRLRDTAEVAEKHLQFIEMIHTDEALKKKLTDQLVSQIFWYNFHPMYRSHLSGKLRKEIMVRIASANIRFCRISLPKRIGLLLCHTRMLFVPELYFYLYYSVLSIRQGGKK